MEKQPSKSNPDISPAGQVIIFLVRVYQAIFSPWIGPSCRHIPSCSVYMIEAVREWGAVKGAWLGVKRLSRCHPWGSSGYDPVPPAEGESS